MPQFQHPRQSSHLQTLPQRNRASSEWRPGSWRWLVSSRRFLYCSVGSTIGVRGETDKWRWLTSWVQLVISVYEILWRNGLDLPVLQSSKIRRYTRLYFKLEGDSSTYIRWLTLKVWYVWSTLSKIFELKLDRTIMAIRLARVIVRTNLPAISVTVNSDKDRLLPISCETCHSWRFRRGLQEKQTLTLVSQEINESFAGPCWSFVHSPGSQCSRQRKSNHSSVEQYCRNVIDDDHWIG